MTTPPDPAYRNSEFSEEDSISIHQDRNEQDEINADREQPANAPYCLIPLTQGQFAKVSPGRFSEVNAFKWYAWWSDRTQSFYAMRQVTVGKKKTAMCEDAPVYPRIGP